MLSYNLLKKDLEALPSEKGNSFTVQRRNIGPWQDVKRKQSELRDPQGHLKNGQNTDLVR